MLHQHAAKSLDDKGANNPSINHQVVYVCHGHCSGPECEFTQSIRHWQSMVRLGDGQCFRSEVVEQAPLSLVKLEEKRRSLDKMKSVLRGKLESKQRHREQRQRSKNSSSGSLKASMATPSPVTRETQTPPMAQSQASPVAQQAVGVGVGGATPEKRPASSAASSTLSEQGVFQRKWTLV